MHIGDKRGVRLKYDVGFGLLITNELIGGIDKLSYDSLGEML